MNTLKIARSICYFLLILTCFSYTFAADVNIIKPGDTININFPGEAQFKDAFTVEPDGRIFLPEVGPVSVGGKHLDAAKKLILDSLSTGFRDLSQVQVVHRPQQQLILIVFARLQAYSISEQIRLPLGKINPRYS